MEIFLTILTFTCTFLLLLFSKWNKKLGLPKLLLPIVFTIKCIVGLIFLYSYAYDLTEQEKKNDTRTFLHESKVLHDVFNQSPKDYFIFLTGIRETEELRNQYLSEINHWKSGDQSLINDNKNIIRIHSLLHFISFGYPSIHMIVFSLVGLIGLTLIFHFFTFFTGINKTLLFLLINFIPSVLFWSSGLLKEPFLLLGLGLFLFTIFTNELSGLKKWMLILLSLFILIGFKPYVIASILPAILFYQIYTKIPQKKLIITLVILAGFSVISATIFSRQFDKTIHSIARKQFDFSNVGRGGLYVYADTCFYYFSPANYNALKIEEDSVQLIKPSSAWISQYGSLDTPIKTHLEPSEKKWLIHFQNEPANSFIEIPSIRSLKDLVLASPNALFNAIIRPLPTDPGSEAKYLAFLESILLLGFLVLSLLKKQPLTEQQKNLIYSTTIFVILLALIIGWVTPVLGAIVRYRLPIQLGLLFITSVLIHPLQKSNTHE